MVSREAVQLNDAGAGYSNGAEIQDVPPGYKRTEVGVIPEDWPIVPLGALGVFSKGQGIRKNECGSGYIPCVRYGELYTHHNNIIHGFYSYISAEVAKQSKKIKKGDILFAGSGETKNEIGKSIAFIGNEEAYAGGDIVIFTPNTGDSTFLGYLLNAPNIADQKASKGQGDAVVHISAAALSSIKIPFPPTEKEQHAIAKALSDVDGLLGALDALIAKKLAIKQAAMQQLLTGKTRLPWFSGEWETKRLGDVAELHRQNVVPAEFGTKFFSHFSLPAFDDGKSPVIEPGHNIGSNKFRVPSNAILVSKLNPRIPRIWFPHIGVFEAVASTEFLILTPREEISRLFLYIICSSPLFSEKLEVSATGTTGSHQRISPSDALEINVHMPVNVNEQTAIATVLSDMDAEISALEHRRDKTQQIKQGMMQQLLTGRIRLVNPRRPHDHT